MKGEIYMISTRTIKREKCKFCGKELEQKTMSLDVTPSIGNSRAGYISVSITSSSCDSASAKSL